MNTVTILTQGFAQELESINLCCDRAELDTDALTHLLERIVIFKHPVYGHSRKLADMATELCGGEIHQANRRRLDAYLLEHDELHLEGYAAFRMSDYRNKLDMLMYRLIKKLKLTESLLL